MANSTNEARYDRLDLGLSGFYPKDGVMGIFDEKDELAMAFMDWSKGLEEIRQRWMKHVRPEWRVRPIHEDEIIGYLTRRGIRQLDQRGTVQRLTGDADRLFR